jgi:TatA/E family protein of Tat protein translocase
MGISGGEIIFIILVILMLFGADKIPELVRSFGKGMNEIKKATDEIKREITENVGDIRSELLDVKSNFEQEARKITDDAKQELQGFDPYESLNKEENAQLEVPVNREVIKRGQLKKTDDMAGSSADSQPLNYDI